jgi:hypothetical protein
MKFPSPEEIAEMKARGYDMAAIEAAEIRSKREEIAWTICEKIQHAFAGVKLGNGVGLQEAQGLDDRENKETCAALRANDEKHDWQKITGEQLNGCFSSLSFFDAEGMRFHLPAYLIADLKGKYRFGMVGQLSRLSDYTRSQFELLSPDQRDAVRAYLRLTLEDPDCWFDRPRVEAALDVFWGGGKADEEY